MTQNIIIEKLDKIFYECDKHLLRINSSSKKLDSIMPLDEKKYLNLTEDEIQVLDQFLFRFGKLQDAMGQKLFKIMLIFLSEDIEGKPFIDILNIMEKVSLIDDVNEWKELRDDRNELAHNYEDEAEEMSEIINKLYNKRITLSDIYMKIKTYYKSKTEDN